MTADNPMNARTKVLIGIAIVALIGGAAALTITQRRDRGVPVRLDVVARRDLVETVTASGNIRAGRVTDISSEVSARVTELVVDEGDDVVAGQLLLRLDATQFDAAVSRAEGIAEPVTRCGASTGSDSGAGHQGFPTAERPFQPRFAVGRTAATR